MARIAGVNIPTNKRVHIALRYIHGIGPVNAVEICTGPGVYTGNQVRSVQAFHDGTTGLPRHGAGLRGSGGIAGTAHASGQGLNRGGAGPGA